MTQNKRCFIAVHKKSMSAYYFTSRAECVKKLKHSALDIKDYDLWYAYSDMARKPYSSGYAEAHRRAAREYERRKRGYGLRPRGRPKKNSVAG